MKQHPPASPHHPLSEFAALLDLQPQADTQPRPNSALSSYLAHVIGDFDLSEVAACIEAYADFPRFTPPHFSAAFLAARNIILITHRHSIVDVADWEQFRWEQFFGEPSTQEDTFTLLNKPVNNRMRRPEWAKNDWELAQQVIGTPALIAQMEWRQNMNAADIAEALAMKPATVQKAITRMGNDVSRLGLRDGFQVGGSISRSDFALLELKEQGMNDREIAATIAERWFGECAVNRYKIAVMFWQWNMSAIDIAEELQMSVGAVNNVIYRLQAEGE